jgi:hypothetical protein
LVLNAGNAGAFKKMLATKPGVRANWLISVLRAAREEQTGPSVGANEFLPLVSQVMHDAIATPAVTDCGSDPGLMVYGSADNV